MTDEAFMRALDSAIRNAVRMGHLHQGRFAGEKAALDYAHALVLPIHEVCVQQGIEDGYASARLAVPEGAVQPAAKAGAA